jgi:hypothetical protein
MCEDEKEAYFTLEISDIKTIKEAKKLWSDLFICSKTIETALVAGSVAKKTSL